MFDFTLKTYGNLIRSLPLKRALTVARFFVRPQEEVLLLRHDVDALPENSLRFAEIQNGLGVRGTYYFRMLPRCYRPDIIERIAGLGHEIGYHYEDVAAASKTLQKTGRTIDEDVLIELAYEQFLLHLEAFRKDFNVKTICAHGSPLCRYDNRLLWKKHDYRLLGILGDPGLDIDFGDFQYLTDTGRCWNGGRVSLRDKAPAAAPLTFKSTFDILDAIDEGRFPEKVLMTFHPQRWNGHPVRWAEELVKQKTKNAVKVFFVRRMENPNPIEPGR
jgi:hypothetical protein